jgi:glycosyltransferase involved in cell wall biosynthesis
VLFSEPPLEEASSRPPSALTRWLFSLCWLPDDRTGWLPPAVTAGWRLCRQQRIDAIVSSGPPHTAHLVALSLHHLTRLPWIADFRDPWTGNPGKPWFVRSALSDWLEGRLERRVVRSAARLLTATDQTGAALARRHPGIAPKLTTVWTGFEPTRFDALGAVPPAPTFTVAHVGTVYLNRSPRALLEALALLTRDGRIPPSRIRLVFIGDTSDTRAAIIRQAETLGILHLLTFVGRVPYDEALRWMLRAHLLVLLAQGQPAQIPTKSFEYLASGTPLLGIMEEGATADLLRSTKTAVVPDDPGIIADQIHQHFVAPPAARAPCAWRRAEVLPYTRERATETLASLLDETVDRR